MPYIRRPDDITKRILSLLEPYVIGKHHSYGNYGSSIAIEIHYAGTDWKNWTVELVSPLGQHWNCKLDVFCSESILSSLFEGYLEEH
jgi:hypothetical protein